MTSISTVGHNTADSFQAVHDALKRNPTPLLPPDHVLDKKMTDRITSLHLHPSLEAILHILNHDLNSAHFLVRHMQTSPQDEGMYIHGILHRIEGDYDNARAWYGNVCETECFANFWSSNDDDDDDDKDDDEDKKHAEEQGLRKNKDGNWTDDRSRKVPLQARARAFLDAIEELKSGTPQQQQHQQGKDEQDSEKRLADISEREIDAVVRFCAEKYGTGIWNDASTEWVQPEQGDVADKKKDMLTGGAGHRSF